jgi:hypothetical protein
MGTDTDANRPTADGTEKIGRESVLPTRSGFAPVEAAITITTLAVDNRPPASEAKRTLAVSSWFSI